VCYGGDITTTKEHPMAHSCPDGTHSRLVREGPVGTMEGVTFSCPRCGYVKSAILIYEDTKRVLSDPKVLAALR
jgi:predicted RNA-binding Zn-ribbon protein involved in translation (DUF1610 family)